MLNKFKQERRLDGSLAHYSEGGGENKVRKKMEKVVQKKVP